MKTISPISFKDSSTMPKFVPRQRKHKLKQRAKHNDISVGGHGQDSNAAEILPVTKNEKEEKRRRLKADLRAQQPKVSSKKQKRLDKYIVRLDAII